MNKNTIVIIIIVAVVIVLGSISLFGNNTQSPATNNLQNNQQAVKEFSMTAFYDNAGVWFSVKEMSVNKGDLVRVKVTNIKGTHDFTIDEYGINKITPLNEEVIVEFTADKAGEFIYYCSIPGHREKGQWGTLKVLD